MRLCRSRKVVPSPLLAWFGGFGRACPTLFVCGLLAACGSEPQTASPVQPPVKEPPVAAVATIASAQEQFGGAKWPAALAGPSVIGSYARGCLARAQALPLDGPHWQVMRPSRNRYWGHPALISFIERLSERASNSGWRGLLVGDLGQPRGGPATSGHASHQIGLDADIWLTEMPARRLSEAERETTAAPSMLKADSIRVDRSEFTPGQAALIKRAAQFDEVARIFVNPGIKKALCQSAGHDRAWLAKVRPWRGHDEHFHVRLRCPAGETMCQTQEPPPVGDGCGAELTSWLKSKDWLPGHGPEPVPAPIPMSALPGACVQVIQAPDERQTAVNR